MRSIARVIASLALVLGSAARADEPAGAPSVEAAAPDGAPVAPVAEGREPPPAERLAARAGPRPLRVDHRISIPVTLAAAGLAGGLALPELAPAGCRMCGAPGDFDAGVRDALRLEGEAALRAREVSDLLANAVLPAGVVGALALAERGPGGLRRLGDDLVVVLEAVAIAQDLNGAAKVIFARERPASGNLKSFYSGHTSLAFSLATAAGTVSTLRGHRAAPWIWAGGLLLATGVGVLRVAGDAHWATDVLVGAAAGGAVGFLVPWTFHRVKPGRHRVALAPAPGGIALVW